MAALPDSKMITSTPIIYTSTIIPTITPKIENNVTITPSFTYRNRFIIFNNEMPIYYARDINNNKGWLFGLGSKTIYDILSWEKGCEIIAIMDEGVVEIDLHGNIVRSIFKFELLTLDLENEIPHYFFISPDENWVAYRVGSGEFFDSLNLRRVRFEVENLHVLSTDGSQGPYQISSGGDVITFAWSPDSKRLAYDDLDGSGLHQVFAVNLDGSQLMQLTNFELDVEVNKIEWSPDGSRLAIDYREVDDWNSRTTMIVKDEAGAQPNYYRDMGTLWWKDADTLIIYQFQGMSKYLIRQLEVESGNYVGQVHVKLDWEKMIPFGNPGKVGFFQNDDNFYVYDTDRHTVTRLFNLIESTPEDMDLLESMIASPDSFPGEGACPVP
jgi:hypothetical protein